MVETDTAGPDAVYKGKPAAVATVCTGRWQRGGKAATKSMA